MEGIRRPGRFVKQLKAQYFLEEIKGVWEECTVTNISPGGIKIEFYETINVGSTITIMIIIPGESKPMRIKETLKWIKKRESDFIGGIELTEKLDDSTFAKLI